MNQLKIHELYKQQPEWYKDANVGYEHSIYNMIWLEGTEHVIVRALGHSSGSSSGTVYSSSYIVIVPIKTIKAKGWPWILRIEDCKKYEGRITDKLLQQIAKDFVEIERDQDEHEVLTVLQNSKKLFSDVSKIERTEKKNLEQRLEDEKKERKDRINSVRSHIKKYEKHVVVDTYQGDAFKISFVNLSAEPAKKIIEAWNNMWSTTDAKGS